MYVVKSKVFVMKLLFFFFWAVLRFELRVFHLAGKQSHLHQPSL
jgi:hypothetical protein